MKDIFVLAIAMLLFSPIIGQEEEIEQDWTSFVQFMKVDFDRKTKFKLKASVKADIKDEAAWAGLWARVDNSDSNEMGFFDNMGDRPIKTNSWETYEIEGYVDGRSRRLNVGGLVSLNGSFYFDDFRVYLETKNGDFEEMSLQNASFEEVDESGVPTSWNAGITAQKVTVKGYEFLASEDAVNGERSLLIKGSGVVTDSTNYITVREGYSPQMGTLVSMLESLSKRVERVVGNLSVHETDWLLDEEANSIGALIMHLAATEVIYQAYTFEGRGFNEAESEAWSAAMDLDDAGREAFKGKEISYYLERWKEVRQKTLDGLKQRDDAWLYEVPAGWNANNYWAWFHVMEHQSSHLGQILLLQKRIPPETKIVLPEKVQD